MNKNHFFSLKFSLNDWFVKCLCVCVYWYKEVRNVHFSKYFVHVLNPWSPTVYDLINLLLFWEFYSITSSTTIVTTENEKKTFAWSSIFSVVHRRIFVQLNRYGCQNLEPSFKNFLGSILQTNLGTLNSKTFSDRVLNHDRIFRSHSSIQ